MPGVASGISTIFTAAVILPREHNSLC